MCDLKIVLFAIVAGVSAATRYTSVVQTSPSLAGSLMVPALYMNALRAAHDRAPPKQREACAPDEDNDSDDINCSDSFSETLTRSDSFSETLTRSDSFSETLTHSASETRTPSPSGCPPATSANCGVYMCVERLRPCGPTGYVDVLGLPNCNLFLQQETSLFTPTGASWSRYVRQCLQQQLFNLAQAGSLSTLSCPSLANYALASHIGCYTSGPISLCALPFSDYIALMRSVYRQLNPSTDPYATQVWAALLSVGGTCAWARTKAVAGVVVQLVTDFATYVETAVQNGISYVTNAVEAGVSRAEMELNGVLSKIPGIPPSFRFNVITIHPGSVIIYAVLSSPNGTQAELNNALSIFSQGLLAGNFKLSAPVTNVSVMSFDDFSGLVPLTTVVFNYTASVSPSSSTRPSTSSTVGTGRACDYGCEIGVGVGVGVGIPVAILCTLLIGYICCIYNRRVVDKGTPPAPAQATPTVPPETASTSSDSSSSYTPSTSTDGDYYYSVA